MTVKNPDADASEWHAPNARSDTPRTQGVSPLTRSGHLRHRLRAAARGFSGAGGLALAPGFSIRTLRYFQP